jgi:hypothetical protein
MATFVNKSILLISPQDWGRMHLSKHHYALELARRGNRVYFLNPPDSGLSVAVNVRSCEVEPNLRIVSYRPLFPMDLRFHLRRAFDALMRLQLRRLLARLAVRFDVVWCFATFHYKDLSMFGAETVIYHVVDFLADKNGVVPARNANLLVSVAQEFLDEFRAIQVRKIVVNHGLAACFATQARKVLSRSDFGVHTDHRVRCGYVGNLLNWNLGRRSFMAIVESHPAVDFHLWGAYRPSDCNVAADDSTAARGFIARLMASPNVILHGVRTPAELAEEMQQMDCFLVSYDRANDLNNSCNSHKVLEYLSTGKVVVSNRLSFYQDHTDLIRMPDKHNDQETLRLVFADTVRRLHEFNRPELQRKRIQLALDNTYAKQVERIDAELGP